VVEKWRVRRVLVVPTEEQMNWKSVERSMTGIGLSKVWSVGELEHATYQADEERQKEQGR